MHIIHIIDSDGMYGAERALLLLAKESKSRGHAVTIGSMLAPRDSRDDLGEAAVRLGINHVQFRMRNGLNIAGLRRILRYVSAKGIHLIHSHGYRANILFGICPVQCRPCPIVATLHGWTAVSKVNKVALYESIERRIVTRLDAVAVVDDGMKRRLKTPSDQCVIHFIPNGVDLSSVATNRGSADEGEQAECNMAGTSERASILAISRLSREKGIDVLIRAFERVAKHDPIVRLQIAGSGAEESRLRALIEELGLQHRVQLLGFVENTDELYATARLLVIPSRTEGLPLVLLEAMSRRIPIVATSVGQMPNVLGNGEFGLLVAPDSVPQLANAIVESLSDPHAAKSRALLGSVTLAEEYASHVVVDRYFTVYEQVLSR